MSVVGTIVANIVANTAQFEAGMKKAASIHQSTIKQIQQNQEPLHRQFFGKSDFIKNISKAERISASDWSKELIAAGEKTQKEIAARAKQNPVKLKVDAGSSLMDSVKGVALLAGGFTAAAGTALSLASAYDELQKSNWIAKNAEQLASYNRHMEKAVENIHKLSSSNELAGSVGSTLFGGELSGISPRLRQALASGKQTRMSGGQAASENEAIDKLVRMQAATLSPLEFANDLFKKAKPGESLGLLEEARLKQNQAIQKLGSAESFASFRTGFQNRYNAGASGDPAKLKAWDDAIEEHGKLVTEAHKPLNEFNKKIAELQVNTTDAVHSFALDALALKQSIVNSAGGKSVFQIANDITAGVGRSVFGGGLSGLKDLAKTLTDPTARGRLLGESLPASEAFKAELARIDGMKNLLPEDANLLRGSARNRFASQLGSGFNQTRLFAAMSQGSSAAISAINEAQNRIKSPEEMTLNEQLEESKRQTRLLEEIGKKTTVELKAANWTK